MARRRGRAVSADVDEAVVPEDEAVEDPEIDAPVVVPACALCGETALPLYWHHGQHRCKRCRNKPA
jgi:hypothetical protein